jgi:hypothetical protein
LNKDLRLALMAGIDIPVPECKLIIHQPKIKEIAFLGDEHFLQAHKLYAYIKVCSLRAM